MSLRHAILGFLADRPMSGYDLKTQAFDGTIGHFWPADQSQIYRTLDRLVDDGLATVATQPGQGPARKVYTITRAGRDELTAWMQAGVMPPAVREPHLIALFFSEHVPKAQVRAQLEAWRDAYAARLAAYEAIGAPKLSKQLPTSEKRRLMTLEMGLMHARMGIDWAERCLRVL